MHRLRNRLILAFMAATLIPLAATLWIAASLLDRSLDYATTGDVDRLAARLEITARQFYQAEREDLRQDALAGRVAPTTYQVSDERSWPGPVRTFWESHEPERFALAGPGGERVEWLRRRDGDDGVDVFARDLRGVRMDDLAGELRHARAAVESLETRDLRRGFTRALLLLVAIVWLLSLTALVVIAHRISRPIQGLTAGLTAFAGGDWSSHVDPIRDDEVGRAVEAFNRMAEQLRQNRDRLVYLTQVASWQTLARKTAHEVKNSLTPIRLTIEEMLARQPAGADHAFMEQAAQIVISEIDTLERRIRAFSEFGGEPPVHLESLDLNALVAERVSLLRPAHPHTNFSVRLDTPAPQARGSGDLVKGILTNLLQNASEAAGRDGAVLAITRHEGTRAVVEVHDSGPGLSAEARATLFEPTITFKKHGMGLGLSIAKRNALLCGGDVTLADAVLGGAAFQLTLPAVEGQARS